MPDRGRGCRWNGHDGTESGAGQVVLCCGLTAFALQVCVFGLNGDANRPLVHSDGAGEAIFADRGRYSP